MFNSTLRFSWSIQDCCKPKRIRNYTDHRRLPIEAETSNASQQPQTQHWNLNDVKRRATMFGENDSVDACWRRKRQSQVSRLFTTSDYVHLDPASVNFLGFVRLGVLSELSWSGECAWEILSIDISLIFPRHSATKRRAEIDDTEDKWRLGNHRKNRRAADDRRPQSRIMWEMIANIANRSIHVREERKLPTSQYRGRNYKSRNPPADLPSDSKVNRLTKWKRISRREQERRDGSKLKNIIDRRWCPWWRNARWKWCEWMIRASEREKEEREREKERERKRENADSTRVWFFYVIVAVKSAKWRCFIE